MQRGGQGRLLRRSPQMGSLSLLLQMLFKLLLAAGAHAFPTTTLTTDRSFLRAFPGGFGKLEHHDDGPELGPNQWVYLTTAVALVLLGGAFAGLTIALMGQDEIYLQVIATSGLDHERQSAQRVLNLLNRGKHWVLVTILLSNVITNETLPIMLDRSLGGGLQAVVGSTVLIVIFGEVVPQSICVRYGLPIGSFMAPFVWMLMILLAPIAWPTAKLLDWLLGIDHGTTYKKAGLKTLVTLHRTLGTSPDERLSKDEVTIISAVLDLKEKPIGSIMTPMDDVFTLSADTILDEKMMNIILSEGYSRIPIYAVNDPSNFIGMLLVKMLITYDPEDCLRVGDFQLATLPETRPETSCLDIVNFFQEGKSHMVLVSEFPGEANGALGVVTLEDVIEELIGEEIIDESDVFVDVHKAIRRLHPAPWFRVPKSALDLDIDAQEVPPPIVDPTVNLTRTISASTDKGNQIPRHPVAYSDYNPPHAQSVSALLKKRRSSGGAEPLLVDRKTPDIRAHLRHLGPSNAAAAPKQTKINTVKIKPGKNQGAKRPENTVSPYQSQQEIESVQNSRSKAATTSSLLDIPVPQQQSESAGLLSAGLEARDGVHAVGYGTLGTSPTSKTRDAEHRVRMASVAEVINPVDGSEAMIREGDDQSENTNNMVVILDEPNYNDEVANFITLEEQQEQQGLQEHNTHFQGSTSGSSSTAGPSSTSTYKHHPSPNPSAMLEPPSRSNQKSPFPAKLIVSSEHPESVISEDERNEERSRPDESSSGSSSTKPSSMRSAGTGNTTVMKPAFARSGSILERDVDVGGGVTKVVLETADGHPHEESELSPEGPEERTGEKKKRRKKRGGKKTKKAGQSSTNE